MASDSKTICRAGQSGAVALITGAAGGIGRALVLCFRDAGYAVIATDHPQQPPPEGAEHWLPVDLAALARDEALAQDWFAGVQGCLAGRGLAALVNNAAVQVLGAVADLDRNAWTRTLDVNLLAPFLLVQGFLNDLEAASGAVVNIGSIHARLTKAGFTAYATSKAALGGLTRAMAVDLGPRVRVNAIEPAAIDTEMLRAGFAGRPDLYRQLEACHPQGRIGTPEEVARLALALASPGMGFLHGATVCLDGGIGARLFDPA